MLGKTEGRKRRGRGGWDGWMASSTQWAWIWANSGSWWWTGRSGMLQSMGSQRFGHDWVTELNWTECNCVLVWTFFALPFFGMGMKTELFQSCGNCWVFQICWHIECSTFTASSFRIWKDSAGIPSLPLALFVVMLPKAHVTSQSRMSGYRWVITPSWLSGSLRSFLYSSSFGIVLLCILHTCS